MKKLFVSVPMKGRTEDEIKASIAKMKSFAELCEGEELELIDSYIEETPPENCNIPVWYLAKSIEKMTHADVFITIDDTWEWNGCDIENSVAAKYGIKRLYVKAEYVIPNYRLLIEKRVPAPTSY